MHRFFSTSLAALIIAIACPTLVAAQTNTIQNHYFDSNGVKIRYIDEGPREAEPVVLIHGFSANIDMMWTMSGLVDTLAKEYRVIALDCRGHGQSDKPHDADKYGNEMILDVVRLLDHLKVDKAHIVGYSMGGMITLKLIADHPDRIISAIPAGFAPAATTDANIESMMNVLADALEHEGSIGPLIRHLTPSGTEPPSEAEIKQIDQMITLFNDTKALAACARGSFGMSLDETKLAANTVPALIIVGSEDPLGAGAQALQERLANSEVRIIEGADHMSAFSIGEFLEAGLAFVKKHARETVEVGADDDGDEDTAP